MKHIARLLVAILIMGGVGYSVYFFFFKPDSDLSTFTRLTEMVDYRENQCSIKNIIDNLRNNDTHGDSNKFKFDGTINADDSEIIEHPAATIYKDILTYRHLLTNEDLIGIKVRNTADGIIEDDVNNEYIYLSYHEIQLLLDEAFNYYYAYVQVASDVKASSQKEINKLADTYESQLRELKNEFDLVVQGQKSYNFVISGTTASDNVAAHSELLKRYINMTIQYRKMLCTYANLVGAVRNFVIQYVFNGDILSEISSIKHDIFVITAKQSLKDDNNAYSYNSDASQKYLTDMYLFVSNENEIDSLANESSRELINIYNDVVKNYEDGLYKAMALDSVEKRKFVSNDANENATVRAGFKAEYVTKLARLIELCGYGV